MISLSTDFEKPAVLALQEVGVLLTDRCARSGFRGQVRVQTSGSRFGRSLLLEYQLDSRRAALWITLQPGLACCRVHLQGLVGDARTSFPATEVPAVPSLLNLADEALGAAARHPDFAGFIAATSP